MYTHTSMYVGVYIYIYIAGALNQEFTTWRHAMTSASQPGFAKPVYL